MDRDEILNILNDNNQVLIYALEQIDFTTFVKEKIEEQIGINNSKIEEL